MWLLFALINVCAGKHEDVEGKAFTGAEFKDMNKRQRLDAGIYILLLCIAVLF